jgi:AraC-like DNA-binding protein
MTRVADRVRGILRPASAAGTFSHGRTPPSSALGGIVQHFWSVHWDLRGGAPHTAETLPHPNVHLVFATEGAKISGVQSRKFTTTLEGQGRVFGMKFRPGAFRPFLGGSVAALRDQSVDISKVFGKAGTQLASQLSGFDSDQDAAAALERFLLERLPPTDAKAELAGNIVDEVAENRAIIAVEQLVDRWHMNKRSLQALHHEYVGVGPKWVINRYRLHEALERLHQGSAINCTQLALELGYFDQAHFIRDFRALVGCTPAAYARNRAQEPR